MQRRDFLAGAIGGTGLLTAGVGSAAGAGGWWGNGDGGGNGGNGGSGPEVDSTTFDRRQPDSGTEPGAQVECTGTSVQITGVAEVSDSCQQLVLESASYDGDTLTVTVTSESSGTTGACAEVITPRSYAATVVASSQPARVVVEHSTVSGSTFTRECGVGSGGGSDGGSGGDGGGDVTTEFDVDGSGSLTDSPGATIECQGTTVEIDGTIEVQDTCHTATLGDVEFDGEELTVTVEETQREDAGACLFVITPISYTATVETPSAPETVTVVHSDASEQTFEHTCGGAASDGWAAGGSTGDGSTGDGGEDTGTGGGWW